MPCSINNIYMLLVHTVVSLVDSQIPNHFPSLDSWSWVKLNINLTPYKHWGVFAV